jgi:cell division protein FtsN
MAARRGKSQARRNTGNSGGLPGWAWLVLGIVLTLIVILMAPKWLKSDGGDGFIRPKPNPDAQPAAVSSAGEDSVVQESDAPNTGAAAHAATDAKPAQGEKDDKQQYDFYTLLPGQEVAMSDAELAASERAEEERQRKLTQQQQQQKQQQQQQQPPQTAAANTLPAQIPEQRPTPATTAPATTPANTAPVATPAPQVAAADTQARYILQAGAFGASGDAETLKARIAMLGLNARVESASIGGKTVYRVRMGPYGTATELAEAKRKLGTGGLPAMAVKAK